MPRLRSKVLIALCVMLFISPCRNALRASFMVMLLLDSPLRYIPVVSIVTASFPLSSMPIVASSFFIAMSSGASSVNSSPMSLRVLVTFTPQLNATLRLLPPSETRAFTLSVAVMFSRGFIMSPENST